MSNSGCIQTHTAQHHIYKQTQNKINISVSSENRKLEGFGYSCICDEWCQHEVVVD